MIRLECPIPNPFYNFWEGERKKNTLLILFLKKTKEN
jgi:hypothetical protein